MHFLERKSEAGLWNRKAITSRRVSYFWSGVFAPTLRRDAQTG